MTWDLLRRLTICFTSLVNAYIIYAWFMHDFACIFFLESWCRLPIQPFKSCNSKKWLMKFVQEVNPVIFFFLKSMGWCQWWRNSHVLVYLGQHSIVSPGTQWQWPMTPRPVVVVGWWIWVSPDVNVLVTRISCFLNTLPQKWRLVGGYVIVPGRVSFYIHFTAQIPKMPG